MRLATKPLPGMNPLPPSVVASWQAQVWLDAARDLHETSAI